MELNPGEDYIYHHNLRQFFFLLFFWLLIGYSRFQVV